MVSSSRCPGPSCVEQRHHASKHRYQAHPPIEGYLKFSWLTSENSVITKFSPLHHPGPERCLMYAGLCTFDTLHKITSCIGPGLCGTSENYSYATLDHRWTTEPNRAYNVAR